MALTDRLQILIEAAGGPAISEFGKVATAAKTDFSTVSTEAQKAEANVAKLETRLSNAKPGTARYDTISAQLGAARTEADKFSQSGGRLSSALDRIGISGTGMGTAVAAGAATAGTAIAIGLVGAVKAGVDSFVQLGNETRQVQRLTGATAEDASRFNSVLRQMGISAEDAAKPLGLLASNVATHSAKFAEAGVAIAHYKDGTTNLLGTLENIRQKFQDTADATQRDAFAKATLGRGYQTLLPYLSASTDRIKEFQDQAQRHGEVINQADVEKSRQFGVATRELSAGVKQVERDLGSGLVPVLTDTANALDGIIGKVDHLLKIIPGGGIGKLFDFTSKAGVPGLSGLTTVNDLSQGHFTDALKDNVPLLGLLTGGHKKAADAATDQADAEQALNQKLQDALVVDQDVKAAQDGVISSAKSFRSAQQALADAHESEISAEKGVTRAQQEHDKAMQGVTKATQDLASAQRDLDTALKGASYDEITDSNLALRSATLGVAEAEKQLAEAKRTSPYYGSLELDRARLGLDEAIQRQREAQEKVTATKAQGTPADPNVVSARQKVASAQDALAQARDREKTAADNITTAVDNVQKAKDREKDSSYNLRDAQDALNTAISTAVGLNANTIGQVDTLIGKYPELADALNKYKAALGAPPPAYAPGADTAGGGLTPGPVPPLRGAGPLLPGQSRVAAPTSGPRPRAFAEGGLIPGKYGQEVPIIAHGGEWVVSPSNPQSAIDALRALGYMKPFNAAPAGSDGGSAPWTPGGSTSNSWARVTNYNVTGNKFETPNAQALHDELERQQRLKALSGG